MENWSVFLTILFITYLVVFIVLKFSRKRKDRSKLNSSDFYRYNCPSTVMTSAHHGVNSSPAAVDQFKMINAIMAKHNVKSIPESFSTELGKTK